MKTSTKPSTSPVPNGSASGACTCAWHEEASRRVFSRSTRPAAPWPLRRKAARDFGNSPVGTGLFELIGAVAARCDPDHFDPGAVAGLYVAGGVAYRDASAIAQG